MHRHVKPGLSRRTQTPRESVYSATLLPLLHSHCTVESANLTPTPGPFSRISTSQILPSSGCLVLSARLSLVASFVILGFPFHPQSTLASIHHPLPTPKHRLHRNTLLTTQVCTAHPGVNIHAPKPSLAAFLTSAPTDPAVYFASSLSFLIASSSAYQFRDHRTDHKLTFNPSSLGSLAPMHDRNISDQVSLLIA